MKLGLFGGSFDPVHAGHVVPVRAAARAVGLDRVIYLPTADPPHKGPRSAAAHRRLCMVELALIGDPDLHVSSFELTPGRTAYTVDSVRYFGERYPEAELHLLLGGDSFLELARWRSWSEIVERTTLVVMTRPGWAPDPLTDELDELVQTGKALLIENPPVAVASRRLRAQLRAGQTPDPGAISPLVLDYVRKYGLYR